LPYKALIKINGKRAIEYVIERVKGLGYPVILCTTEETDDDTLCLLAMQNNIRFFRGSTEDKLMRWYKCADHHDVDFFVSADGDDILVSTELIKLAMETDLDFIEAHSAPCGAFSTGIKTSALKKVCHAKKTNDTEMVSDYFKTLCNSGEIDVPEKYKRPYRMTLDYKEDLLFFQNVISNIPEPYTLDDIIEYLDTHPEVIAINNDCQQMYLDNQKAKTKLVI